MFDRIILSIRQQVEKGSKIIWDIFEILVIYCIDKMVVSIWVFVFALVNCLTIGIVRDNCKVGWSAVKKLVI